MVHTFNPSTREEYKAGWDRNSLSSVWRFHRGKSSLVLSCFAFLIFRLNPSICLWVFIIHAIVQTITKETTQQANQGEVSNIQDNDHFLLDSHSAILCHHIDLYLPVIPLRYVSTQLCSPTLRAVSGIKNWNTANTILSLPALLLSIFPPPSAPSPFTYSSFPSSIISVSPLSNRFYFPLHLTNFSLNDEGVVL